jgi:DNA-binding MarR family transcriptional regulator
VPAGCGRDLGWLLAATLHGYVVAGESALEAVPGGLRGYHALAAAAEGRPGTQLELARLMRLDRTVMTHLIDALEAEGLVERRPDPADRRARHVVVTEKGTGLLREVREALSVVEQGMLAPLSIEERKVFLEAVGRLAVRATAQGAPQPAEICGAVPKAFDGRARGNSSAPC